MVVTKGVMVLEFDDPDFDLFPRVMAEIHAALAEREDCKPTMVHLSIKESADKILNCVEEARKEDEMALRKHGEGEVIPETDQQKTAAAEGGGMSKEAAEELRQENEAADGGND